MLTVKHIPLPPGPVREYVVGAHHVEFRKNDNGFTGVLAFNEPRYVVGEFRYGAVYVMNEQGQTVAAYNLGQAEDDESYSVDTP